MVTLSFLLLITNLIFSIIEFFVGFRILLRFFNANPTAPFVNWVYDASDSLIAPFQGMFPASRIEGGFIIDFTALFALLIYLFIHYAIMEALRRSEYTVERARDDRKRR